LILDHNGYLPAFVHSTDGKTHEVRVLKGVISDEFRFPAGSIVAFDKGYIDLELFNRCTEEGIIPASREGMKPACTGAAHRSNMRCKLPMGKA
jgi:hypothetical protein